MRDTRWRDEIGSEIVEAKNVFCILKLAGDKGSSIVLLNDSELRMDLCAFGMKYQRWRRNIVAVNRSLRDNYLVAVRISSVLQQAFSVELAQECPCISTLLSRELCPWCTSSSSPLLLL
jgi:hypothetical protein